MKVSYFHRRQLHESEELTRQKCQRCAYSYAIQVNIYVFKQTYFIYLSSTYATTVCTLHSKKNSVMYIQYQYIYSDTPTCMHVYIKQIYVCLCCQLMRASQLAGNSFFFFSFLFIYNEYFTYAPYLYCRFSALLNPSQIIRRLTFLTPSLTTRLIQKFV